MQDINSIIDNLKKLLSNVQDEQGLDQIKAKFLGKNSVINDHIKKLSSLSHDEKRKIGKEINELKTDVSILIKEKQEELLKKKINQKLSEEKLDLSLPGRIKCTGSIHPISRAMEEITEILVKFGFYLAEGPNIEDEWHNFTALNIPEHHPAKEMHDTFYLQGNNLLLRTHTSPVQIRELKKKKPPIRFICSGRTYRSDSDSTHTPMFHQIEGLALDKNISMAHLKSLLTEMIQLFFGRNDLEIRFRPSFFPFTEPSAEVDIRIKGEKRWLEVLGCGMVHPNVLSCMNVNSHLYQGFAFGLGVERFASIKYNIPDLRNFYCTDIRWLDHYGVSSVKKFSLAEGF